jgi:hypothetical protein
VKLRELEPVLLRHNRETHRAEHVERLEDADGIRFACPKCFAANGGLVGTHLVRVSFDGKAYGKGWNVGGSSLDDLTLTPSIQLLGGVDENGLPIGCGWHGFVTAGEVTSC